MFLVLQMSVRQIPVREFSRRRRTILLLREEKAGMSENFGVPQIFQHLPAEALRNAKL